MTIDIILRDLKDIIDNGKSSLGVRKAILEDLNRLRPDSAGLQEKIQMCNMSNA